MTGNWIWLPAKEYESNQTTYFNPLGKRKPEGNYTVCRLTKKYKFNCMVSRVEITSSADTAFLLLANDKAQLRGPAYSGGDFLDNDSPRRDYYSIKTSFDINEPYIDFCAYVRMMPYHLCEYSKGQGGFYLSGTAYLENGETVELFTGESWDIQLLNSYTSPRFFDARVQNSPVVSAEIKTDIWQAETASILPCVHNALGTYSVEVKNEKATKTIKYDRIYAGYFKLSARTSEGLRVKITPFEVDVKQKAIECIFTEDDTYYSLELNSLGGFDIEADGCGEVEITFEDSHYPVFSQAKIQTSDKDLNTLMEICAHTLKYCRQLHHLDSPLHCEPLACVGDYYIEMLMTRYSFGEYSLCEFDLERIARTIKWRNGIYFHTTYSLIWVKMLYECYMQTGNSGLLQSSREALDLLLNAFDGYKGENGLVENPPSFMFIDWLFPDGISTHHPPKALGQSCLNMFYYGALCYAEKIYRVLGLDGTIFKDKAKKLKGAILDQLYDKQRGLFFEGLNTKTPENMVHQYLPENVEKRYYRKHANILACYFGIVEGKDAESLLERVYTDTSLGEVQPYFMHFWFEAVYKNGLCEKYTLSLLEGWKKSLRECPKGLPEGFYPPEPSYKFDYSHAWGGTPLYSLPQAICGLEILEPAYKKIRLKVQDLGLDSYYIELPTPYGNVVVEKLNGQSANIKVPNGIELAK